MTRRKDRYQPRTASASQPKTLCGSASDMVDAEEAVQLKLMTEETLSFAPTKYQLA